MRFHSFEYIMEGLGAEDEEAMEEVDVATILATMTAAELIDRELIDTRELLLKLRPE